MKPILCAQSDRIKAGQLFYGQKATGFILKRTSHSGIDSWSSTSLPKSRTHSAPAYAIRKKSHGANPAVFITPQTPPTAHRTLNVYNHIIKTTVTN